MCVAEDSEQAFPEVDDTDGLDPTAEFEEWKLRELMRIKRDKEALYAFVFFLSLRSIELRSPSCDHLNSTDERRSARKWKRAERYLSS